MVRRSAKRRVLSRSTGRGRIPRGRTYWRLTESVNVAVIEGWPPVSV
jgi:hypothetical protein